MNEQYFLHLGRRLKEERLRLSLSQLAMADACSVNRNTLAAWERGEQTPNAGALAVMDRLGLDVLYIVVGRRASDASSPLPAAEQELLATWRSSSAKGRAALSAMANALKPE